MYFDCLRERVDVYFIICYIEFDKYDEIKK